MESDGSGADSEYGAARPAPRPIIVGVLSDTHGYLYVPVKQSLAGVDHIIHAGDIGSPHVVAELRAIATVSAVRGNCDYEDWAQSLPARVELELAGVRVLVGHIAAHLRDMVKTTTGCIVAPAVAVVISGHTHQAAMETRDGVLYLNPGSAGPKRIDRPRTVARVTIVPSEDGRPYAGPRVQAEILAVKDG